ncbi:MAG: zinc ribbon domain-containing protein [Chitinophagales bacterium]|jgi:predicted  nucleic acid-binding Zn-ribbon protein
MAELSIAEKLQKLWNLQQVDSQLDEIKILKGELPMEVADLEDELAGLDTRIKRLKATVKEAEGEVSRLQAFGKDTEANLKKYQKQIEEVKNNREYEALQREIDNAKLDIELATKKTKEAKAVLDQKKESLTLAEAKFTARQQDLDTKKQELNGIIEKTNQEEAKLKAHSDQARVGIEDRLLKAYDKTRTTYRNGLAVVTVDRDACGGCFNRIPPQVQLEVCLHKKIIACEHCGRILVDQSIVNPPLVEA